MHYRASILKMLNFLILQVLLSSMRMPQFDVTFKTGSAIWNRSSMIRRSATVRLIQTSELEGLSCAASGIWHLERHFRGSFDVALIGLTF